LTHVWAPRGSRPRAVKQTEYDWIYLYAAVNPRSGDSVALLAPTANTFVMNQHLRMISEHVGPHVHVVLVLDQAGWHMSKGLRVPENITLLPLPPYSPELNPVERLWSWLKSRQLSNRVYADYDDLLNSGSAAWNTLTPKRLQTICRVNWIEREN
jgi:transposase